MSPVGAKSTQGTINIKSQNQLSYILFHVCNTCTEMKTWAVFNTMPVTQVNDSKAGD